MNVETNDDFAAAFAEFSAPDDKKPTEAEPAAATADDAGSKPAEGADNDAGADTDAGAGAEPAATDAGTDTSAEGAEPAAATAESSEGGAEPAPAAEPAAVEKPAVDPDDVLNRLAKIVNETKTEKVEQASAAEAPAAEEKPIYNDEETEFLKGYDADYADVTRGEALKRRAEYRELLQYVFQEVGKFVAPLKETTAVLAERTHLTDLKTNVPDYSDDLRDRVVAWAKSQPEYLQVAYDQVIQHGTADEVRDLVDRYRKETGQAPVVTPAKSGKGDNELSEQAKKAAEALAPVESKRSGVQQPSEPAGFDDAWKQFASTD